MEEDSTLLLSAADHNCRSMSTSARPPLERKTSETRFDRITPRSSRSPRPSSALLVPAFKLRSSCDACGQAKIKCDRGQPSCSRCVTQGLGCVYGISRKAGKPPRKRPAAPPTQSPLHSSPNGSIDAGGAGGSIDLGGSHGHYGIGLAGGDGGNGGSGSHQHHHSMDLMMDLSDGGMGHDSLFSSTAGFQTCFPFDSPAGLGTITPSWSDADMSEAGMKSGEMFSVGVHSLPTPPPTTSSTVQTAAATPSSSSCSGIVMTTPGFTAASPASPRICCTQEAKELMRRLYCANPSAPYSDGVPARSLDLGSVLTRSREIVARMMQLLKCPCARSPHTAMLYASIVSRVLLWYKQAAVSNASQEEGSPSALSTMAAAAAAMAPTSSMQDPTRSQPSSPSLKAFDAALSADDERGTAVLPAPVMVGSFQSEDRGLQTALTNYLLISEMTKVGDLIHAFVSLGMGESDTNEPGDSCPAAGEQASVVADASLFASLGGWLRTEHRRIIGTARSGLSVLDENLRL